MTKKSGGSSSSGGSDRLMFPIGFDLDGAVKQAGADWKSTYATKLEELIQKRPIKIKLDYDIKQLGNLEAVQKRLKELKVAPVTPETKGAISSLVSELKKLESILIKIDQLNKQISKTTPSSASTAKQLISLKAKQKWYDEKLLEYEERLKQAQARTAAAQERYRQVVERTGRTYANMDGYITRLLKRTAVLFGIHQVKRFAQKLRETTAEFELQRVSLGAIIQDTEKANALFNQIKTFAVQSPFEIKDLVSFTKQLAAYGFAAEDLFDTTKRLADIAAGLGADMSRVVLAVGQIRAASVLKGCLGIDTEIITTNGIRKAQDIQVGDKLLNENNEIVTVKELIRGREQMYRVTQSNGMEYRVNENHILTLYKDGELHDVYVKDAIADAEYLGVRYFEGELITYPIAIHKDIVDDYYGFVLDGNKRFQLGDGTVTHNTELRQLTELGIPMVQLLADKFTALRGEVVSTAEVFDLISQKAVSYEMVKEVLDDLTSAGGMFYEMQEKQAATLAGQWSNLKDSFSIMYDEMGNTAGAQAAMKGLIDTTKKLANNWQLVGGLIMQTLGGAAILGAVNKFKSLWSGLGVQMYSATQKATIAQERYNQAVAKQNALLPTATKIEHAAAAAKVKSAAAALKSAQAIEAAAASTNKLTFAWERFTMALKANWISIVIGALLTLYQVISHVIRKTNELKDSLAEIEREGAKNIATTTWNFERLAKKAVDAADGSNEQREALEELQRTYKDMIPTHQLTIENLRKLEGNYRSLTDAVREYAEAQIYVQKYETILADTRKNASEIEKNLQERLQRGIKYHGYKNGTAAILYEKFSERQSNELFKRIEEYAKTTSDDVETILRKSLKDINKLMSPRAFKEMLNIGNFAKLINEWRSGEQELDKLNQRQQESNNKFAQYGKYIDEATDAINEWKNANKTLQSTSPFDFNKQLLEKSGKEYRAALEKIINETNKSLSANKKIKIEDSWFSGEYIDTTAILKALEKAGIDIEAQAYKAVQKIETAYMKFISSNNFVKVINARFESVGKRLGDNVLNIANQDLMKADENIDDFVKRFFDTIDNLELQIQQKEALLAAGIGSTIQLEADEESLRLLKIRLELLKENADFMEQFRKKTTKGGSTEDPFITLMKNRMSFMKDFQKGVEDLSKYMRQNLALGQEQDIMRFRGKSVDIDVKALEGSKEELIKWYDDAIAEVSKKIAKLGGKTWEGLGVQAILSKDTKSKTIKAYQQLLQELFNAQTDFKTDKLKQSLEAELKRLSDEVSRTKTAKEFFDKMLNMTGDRELSATVTMSVYGGTGEGLHDAIVAQIREAFKGIDDTALNLAIGVDTVDYNSLQKIFKDNFERIPEEQQKLIQQLLDNEQKANAEWLLDTFKVYEEFKTFEQQRTTIREREANKRAEIAQRELDDEQKKILTDASFKREAKELNDIDWAEFKASDDWIKTFENIDRVATPTIEHLIVKLRELIDTHKDLTPEQLKTIMREYDKLYNAYIERNPFKGIIDGIKEFKNAQKEIVEARSEVTAAAEEYAAAQEQLNNLGDSDDEQKRAEAVEKEAKAYDRLQKAEKALRDAQDKSKASLSKIASGLNGAANAASGLQSILSQVVDLFGVAEDSELGAFLQEIGKWLGIVATALGVVASMLILVDTVGAPILAIIASVAALGAVITWLANAKVRKANREIEKQKKLLDALDYSYNRLQKTAESLFSSEFVANFRKQQENLRAQIVATEKQLAAERSKGSKKDDEKIKEYEDSIRDLKDQLTDLTSELSTQMLGTDLASAARSFAQSWLDAYKEFGDTAGAIEERMSELMENLMTEAILGAITQKALEPLFKYIDSVDPSDFYKEDFWKDVLDLQQQAQDYMNTGLSVGAQYLEQMGILTRNMGNEMTGISKDIASASEESILGLASLMNTELFYISYVPQIYSEVVAIKTLLQGGSLPVSDNVDVVDLITLQNQHLSCLPRIEINTAQTAERCERAAQACESIAENLNRVIKPNGVPGTHRVVTSLQS